MKSLNPKQIANWCTQSFQCIQAIQKYDDAPIGAFEQNASLFLMGFFEFLDGDPNAIEQASEEEITSWEALAQSYGTKLDDAVSASLASSSKADQAEGEAGAIAQIFSELTGFNVPYGPRGTLGENDIETPFANIEVKSGGVQNAIPKLIKQFNNPITNPDGKAFVVYGPNWDEGQDMQVYEALGSLDTGQAVYVARNPTQLIEVLEYLTQEGPPSF
jgi:hypothetical protein